MLVVGFTAGVTAACVKYVARSAATPGEILTFAGGAVGAGGAVIGALWVESKSGERRRKAFEGALEFILHGAFSTREASDADLTAVISTLFQAFQSLRELRRAIPLDDPLANVALVNLVKVYAGVEDLLKPIETELDEGHSLSPSKRRNIETYSNFIMDATIRAMSSVSLFDKSGVKTLRARYAVPDLLATSQKNADASEPRP